MSEFFLELFSEEIPSRLQINARNDLIKILKKFFNDNEIIIKGKINIIQFRIDSLFISTRYLKM